jgi:hypothetical protein
MKAIIETESIFQNLGAGSLLMFENNGDGWQYKHRPRTYPGILPVSAGFVV